MSNGLYSKDACYTLKGEKSCTKNKVCKASRNQLGTKFLQGGQTRPGKGLNHIDLNSAFGGGKRGV